MMAFEEVKTLYQTIKYIKQNSVVKLFLNKPEVHNAFDEKMIKELIQAFHEIEKDKEIRAVVISGNGKSFCAGADLNWMSSIVNYSFEENIKESQKLSELYWTIYTFRTPVIARVNGAAIGGGFGLVAVCDIIIAAEEAFFKLSEVKVGLVPAVISPYLIRKFGENTMREFFLLGNKVKAERAFNLGIIHRLVKKDKLDEEVEKVISEILKNSPEAVRVCKELLFKVPSLNFYEAKDYTIETIARRRISPDGQEGMKSFLEKRKPVYSITN